MSYIVNIATGVPGHTIEKEDLERFYMDVLKESGNPSFLKKLRFINHRTGIHRRHSCIPDYNGRQFELYRNGNYLASVEERMKIYKEKIVSFASLAIDKLTVQGVDLKSVTHLITVSCTGQCAPGVELLIAERYNIQHVEKQAINFLGCYAAVRGLKHAYHITKSDPEACVLLVSAEMCSLHFYPSFEDEEMLANLLFSDGTGAVLISGESHPAVKKSFALKMSHPGSAVIPATTDYMTWDISSAAFRMFLSTQVVEAIKVNMQSLFHNYYKEDKSTITHWAIHPGGVKIVEAVQKSMGLTEADVAVSMDVLKNYGNMSSATILFILERMFDQLRASGTGNETIFTCAFGPGVNVEMLCMQAVRAESPDKNKPDVGAAQV